MAIANKSLVWGIFAAGGTLTAFLFPAIIVLFLFIASGNIPDGFTFESARAALASWPGKIVMFGVLFLSLWHAAHRMRVLLHDFGIRADGVVANLLYLLATLGTGLCAMYLLSI